VIIEGHISKIISEQIQGGVGTLWRLLCGLLLNRRHLQNNHKHKETNTNTNKRTNL